MQKLAQEFIPAADDQGRIYRFNDPEAQLFRKIAEQGHYAGRTAGGDTRQGVYVFTSSGIFLSSANALSPRAALQVMNEGLRKYKALPKDRRVAKNLPGANLAQSNRFEKLRPKDGLILRVLTRDLPREDQKKGWRARAFNLDYAWFTAFETRWFVPDNPVAGTTNRVPLMAIQRLARLHFTDNVRGQTLPFAPGEVREFNLFTKSLGSREGKLAIEWQGNAILDRRPQWALDDDRWNQRPSSEIRGLALDLYGKGEWDPATNRFISFTLVAVGKRWGITKFNERKDDSITNPLGFLLTLADESPLSKVAPAHWREYRWAGHTTGN